MDDEDVGGAGGAGDSEEEEEEAEGDGEEDEDSDDSAGEGAALDRDDESDGEEEEEGGSEEEEEDGGDEHRDVRVTKEAAGIATAAAATTDASKLPELPYVYTCPTNAKGLSELMALAGPHVARQRELLHRLIAGHHTRLKEANKEKLATLAELLLGRLLTLAETPGMSAFMQPLCPSLFTIAQQLPIQVALVVLQRLQAARTHWRAVKHGRRLGGGGGGDGVDVEEADEADGAGRHTSLPPATLALVALCCQLYSLSDFRHVVLTPLVVFVQEVLAQREGPPSEAALRRMLFLCSCALHVAAAGGRWMPELHAAAHGLFARMVAARHALADDAAATGGTTEIAPLQFDALLKGEEGDGAGAMGCNTAAAIFRLVTDLVTVSAALPAFVELFTPTLSLLTSSEAAELPTPLQPLREACATAVRDALRRAIDARVPLRMQRAPATAIKQFNPAFDDDFQPFTSMDPDRERAERQKLRRKTKQEMKGACVSCARTMRSSRPNATRSGASATRTSRGAASARSRCSSSRSTASRR